MDFPVSPAKAGIPEGLCPVAKFTVIDVQFHPKNRGLKE
jgi:hypothetical protein